MFVCEEQPDSVVADRNTFYPGTKFMGCVTKSPSMTKLADFVVKAVSASHTDELEFAGSVGAYCHKMALNGEIDVIPGGKIGIRKADGSPVHMEDLFGTSAVALSSQSYGILIPEERILSRIKYGYFPRMSSDQISKSQEFVCRAITSAGWRQAL